MKYLLKTIITSPNSPKYPVVRYFGPFRVVIIVQRTARKTRGAPGVQARTVWASVKNGARKCASTPNVCKILAQNVQKEPKRPLFYIL